MLLAWNFSIPLIYIAFVIILNFIVLYLFGSYILRAVIFPYSNFFVKTYLDSLLNRKFGIEFAKLLESMMQSVYIMAKVEPKDGKAQLTPPILEMNSSKILLYNLPIRITNYIWACEPLPINKRGNP